MLLPFRRGTLVAALVTGAIGCSSGSTETSSTGESRPGARTLETSPVPSRPIEWPCAGSEDWTHVATYRDQRGAADVVLAVSFAGARLGPPCVRTDARSALVGAVVSTLGPERASELVATNVAATLLAVPSVRGVRVLAGRRRAIVVTLDGDRSHGVDRDMVVRALSAPVELPAGRAEPSRRDAMLGDVRVGAEGLRLRDVATVEDGVEIVECAGARGNDGRVLFAIEADPEDATMDAIRRRLAELEPPETRFELGRDVAHLTPVR